MRISVISASIVLLLLVLLSACSNDLPPEPYAPGIVGNYYRAIGDWGTAPESFTIVVTDATIDLSVTGDDYVYKFMYVWHEGETRWVPISFKQNTVAGSNWIANTAFLSVPISEFQVYKDSENEIYFVAYACSKEGVYFYCHNNKWQVQIEKLMQSDVPVIEEDDLNPILEDSVIGNDAIQDFPPLPRDPNFLS